VVASRAVGDRFPPHAARAVVELRRREANSPTPPGSFVRAPGRAGERIGGQRFEVLCDLVQRPAACRAGRGTLAMA
jgi:hypothetical protein